ncbi:MAG: gamma-glutamyltransferase [Cyclobacteriaceae bacterium]
MIKLNAVFTLLLILVSCNNPDAELQSYAVSAATPEATQAGMDVLAQGGNAVDAAVAVAFSLAVTEPAMTGLGAGIQMLVSIPGKEPFIINGTTYSPMSTPVSATEEDIIYHRRSTIPSFVKTLGFAKRNYGSDALVWRQLLNAAIDQAVNGFEMGRFRAKVYQQYEKRLLESPFNMSHFLINDSIPKMGDVLKQPYLGKTLQRLADFGADDFYDGEIASIIAKDMAENGGWITLKDLNDFSDPSVVPALQTTYNNFKVFTSTPPCGGWVVLLTLNILEQMDVREERYQRLIKALALAHGERDTNPINNMVDYQAEVATRISKEKASVLIGASSMNLEQNLDNGSGETTHFSVVDGNGMTVSVTTSINAYFGSRAASKELGFIYNSYMEDFVYGNEMHSFSVGPNKMAYSSMCPTVVRDKDGNNVLATGSPGSARIISTVAQTIQYWMDVKQDINEAISAPRVHVNGNKSYLEFAEDEQMQNWLIDNGFDLTKVKNELGTKNLNPYFGGVHAVAFENGYWVSAADPRRDGVAKSVKQ